MIELQRASPRAMKGPAPGGEEPGPLREKGEIVRLPGSQWSGRTTTVKMMVGLLRPDSGRALIGGIDAGKDALSAGRIIGYCPDEPVLYEKMTGVRFLSFIAGARRRCLPCG